MDVARLNFSHGDHNTHRETIRTIRRLSQELDKEVGILQDLRGPKIRIGRLPVSEWVLQTDETAMGEYPLKAVRIMDKIAKATESYLREHPFMDEPMSDQLPTTESAIGRSACRMAEDLHAAAIVAGTASGSTARLVALLKVIEVE